MFNPKAFFTVLSFMDFRNAIKSETCEEVNYYHSHSVDKDYFPIMQIIVEITIKISANCIYFISIHFSVKQQIINTDILE